jgi:hypothetical protein
MGNWSERFANIGGIGYVSLGREEGCSYAACIGCISYVAFCGLRGTFGGGLARASNR